MKKFFSAILIIINIQCFAQTPEWFVSLSIGSAIGGPSGSLKSQMKAQGYGDNTESSFVIFGSGNTRYPRGGTVTLLASGGKKLTDHRSIYFIAGISQKATVEGFDVQGYSNGIFGLFAGSYGNHVYVNYTTYQLTAGYLYSFSKSRTKIGFGPSVYLLQYDITENFSPKEKYSSFVPGASFTARIPFGKQRKLIGVDFVLNSNMAPPVKMTSNRTEGFQPKKASLFSANAGLALSFRR